MLATALAFCTTELGQAQAGRHAAHKPAADDNWAGLYAGFDTGLGGNAKGYSASSAALLPGFIPALGQGATASVPYSFFSPLAGAHVGYNVQSDQLVLGVEADLQHIFTNGGQGSTSTSVAHPVAGLINTTLTGREYADWLGTVRARVGYAVSPDFMIYGTGGLAVGDGHVAGSLVQNLTAFPATSPGTSNPSSSRAMLGWTVGVGGEMKFQQNWSARLEYLYYDLGSLSATSDFTYANVKTTIGTNTVSGEVSGHMVRLGVTYHFN